GGRAPDAAHDAGTDPPGAARPVRFDLAHARAGEPTGLARHPGRTSMSGHRERPRGHGPRGPRSPRTMPIDAAWEEGPRTEAWNELWRRLLASVFEEDEPKDGE